MFSGHQIKLNRPMRTQKTVSVTIALIASTFLTICANNSEACTIITTNDIKTIENADERAALDFAMGTFWPNRNGSFDLGERVQFFHSPTGPLAQNLRFKVHGGTIYELPHAQRLYYQSSPTAAPVIVATRAILSPVAWRLTDGLGFEYDSQKLPAVYPKYSLTLSVVTTSREMTQKLCHEPALAFSK